MNLPKNAAKPTRFYIVSTPPGIHVLLNYQVGGDTLFRSFNSAKKALVKELKKDIATYKLWVKRRKEEIEEIKKRVEPFDRL